MVRTALGLTLALAVAAIAFVAAGLGIIDGPTLWRQATGHISVESLEQGGLRREFRVYRPSLKARRLGLVVVLHGAEASGQQIERQSGFDAQAERLGWVAAYPDGFADGWEPFGCCHHQGVDDVAFIGAIIDQLIAADGVDPDSVYVTGISRGGMMAYRLACELSSRIAAIAPVAGNMADSTGDVNAVSCKPGRPVSILAIHGSDDPEIPISGGRSHVAREEVAYAPFAEVIETWRRLDGCASAGALMVDGAIRSSRWKCTRGSEIETLVVDGGGHVWPGAPLISPPWGPASTLDASRAIADFFAIHQRAPART